MTVKELINDLLDCDMESEVMIRIKLSDQDLEYEDVNIEIEKVGSGFGKETPFLTIDQETITTEKFIESVEDAI